MTRLMINSHLLLDTMVDSFRIGKEEVMIGKAFSISERPRFSLNQTILVAGGVWGRLFAKFGWIWRDRGGVGVGRPLIPS